MRVRPFDIFPRALRLYWLFFRLFFFFCLFFFFFLVFCSLWITYTDLSSGWLTHFRDDFILPLSPSASFLFFFRIVFKLKKIFLLDSMEARRALYAGYCFSALNFLSGSLRNIFCFLAETLVFHHFKSVCDCLLEQFYNRYFKIFLREF